MPSNWTEKKRYKKSDAIRLRIKSDTRLSSEFCMCAAPSKSQMTETCMQTNMRELYANFDFLCKRLLTIEQQFLSWNCRFPVCVKSFVKSGLFLYLHAMYHSYSFMGFVKIFLLPELKLDSLLNLLNLLLLFYAFVFIRRLHADCLLRQNDPFQKHVNCQTTSNSIRNY